MVFRVGIVNDIEHIDYWDYENNLNGLKEAIARFESIDTDKLEDGEEVYLRVVEELGTDDDNIAIKKKV